MPPCPHMRPSWSQCPHCLGINDLNWQDSPDSNPRASGRTPAHARPEEEWPNEVTVYVVNVDWGTMDGYATHSSPWRVFFKEIDAEREAIACKTRKPFPAFSSCVYEMVVQ